MLGEGSRAIYSSGDCEIDIGRRELRVRGAPVPLGGRAFAVIEILAGASGELVPKNALTARLWPGKTVSDNALQVHISALRKALGSCRTLLKTESGRGYRLLGEWTVDGEAAVPRPLPDVPPAVDQEGATNLPAFITPLIGRATATELLRDLVSAYRVVTLTGPGGIGKTTLALHVAHDLSAEFAEGRWLVELASLADPDLVPSAVAGALQFNLGGGISTAAIARAIGGRHLLLILDNCEHVIDAVANLAETLVRSCPRVTILATSREVLRVDGEYVYRVPPLDVPEQDELPDALDHSAIELFIARVRSLDSNFLPDPDSTRLITAICRHLDGIPLAIEFAAARAAALGIEPVASGLRDRLTLLGGGRRTARPRHRTLRATLDWSYELLPEAEQQQLCRLAVFPAGFTLDAAFAVVGDAAADSLAVTNGIANLVNKSLVAAERSEPGGRWRLLETTRAYALEKLVETGDAARVARRHAEFYLALFAPFSTEDRLQEAIDGLDRYRREIDNLRAALNWAFSPEGDNALGVALAATAADFWVAVSQIAEAGEWAGKALALIGDDAGSRREMVLECNLGIALTYTRGMSEAAREALMRALALARQLADFDYQQRAFYGLWLFAGRSMALNEALAHAREYEEVAHGRDPHAQAIADWLVGTIQLYLAEHREADKRLQQAIDQYPVESRGRDMIRFGIDVYASAFGHLSVNRLSLGFLDAASQAARKAVKEARGTNQPVVLCLALTWAAGLVFPTLGDLATAERYDEELIEHADKHALRPFHAAGLCVRGSLAARRGDPESGLDALRHGIVEMLESSYRLFCPFFGAELAAALGALGRIDEGLAEIDVAMRLAEETDYRWFVPEILRVKGELLTRRDSDDPAIIADLFRRAMNQAHGQQALYWELCAATSLAELMQRRQKDAEARAVLAPVYERFTEGFAAPKVMRAMALLDQLGV